MASQFGFHKVSSVTHCPCPKQATVHDKRSWFTPAHRFPLRFVPSWLRRLQLSRVTIVSVRYDHPPHTDKCLPMCMKVKEDWEKDFWLVRGLPRQWSGLSTHRPLTDFGRLQMVSAVFDSSTNPPARDSKTSQNLKVVSVVISECPQCFSRPVRVCSPLGAQERAWRCLSLLRVCPLPDVTNCPHCEHREKLGTTSQHIRLTFHLCLDHLRAATWGQS
eukprot:3598290-Rhodomonas_salina.3